MEKEFVALYDTHSDALFRYISSKMQDRERAKELLQDAFTKYWDYTRTGAELDNKRAFLYRIAHNLVIDDRRKKKPDYSLDYMMEEGFDVKTDSRAEAEIEASDVARHLEKLPANYKEVLVMRYIDDLEIPEIAEILNEAENTVSVRLHRAIKKLREVFSEEDDVGKLMTD